MSSVFPTLDSKGSGLLYEILRTLLSVLFTSNRSVTSCLYTINYLTTNEVTDRWYQTVVSETLVIWDETRVQVDVWSSFQGLIPVLRSRR